MLAAILVLAVGCAEAGTSAPSSAVSAPPSGAAAPTPSEGPISPVIGTVVSVDPAAQASPATTPKTSAKPGKSASPTPASTFSEVRGFTLLTTGGETMTFVIGELDNADDFPADSLYDRLSTGDPIRVFFTVDGDTLVVYHIEDAG